MIKQNIIFSEEVLRTRRTHILLSIWTLSHHPFPKVIAVLLVSPDEWRTSRNLQVNSPAVKRPPSEEQLVRWDCLLPYWPLSLHACWPLNERQCLLLQNVENGLASSTKKKKKVHNVLFLLFEKGWSFLLPFPNETNCYGKSQSPRNHSTGNESPKQCEVLT